MMTNFGREIDDALLTEEPIPREKVVLWIDTASDLASLRLTGEGYYRIQPDLGQEVTCTLIQRYLLECIRQNVATEGEIQGRWEAAGTLHAWFCHLVGMTDTSAILKRASQAVTELFLTSGE